MARLRKLKVRNVNYFNAGEAIQGLEDNTCFEVEYYFNGNSRSGYQDTPMDGRYDRGEPIVIKMWGIIQPTHDDIMQSSLVSEASGDRSEGEIVIHIDKEQQENIIVAKQYSHYFKNGIELNTTGDADFSNIIRWQDKRWKVIKSMRPDNQQNQDNRLIRVEASLFTDVQQNMRASKDQEILF